MNYLRNMRKLRRAAAIKTLQRMPKPPIEDGICACGCIHRPTRGPCPKFISGPGKRCVLCDHSIACHRRKGEPPPQDWDFPDKFPEKWLVLAPPRIIKEHNERKKAK